MKNTLVKESLFPIAYRTYGMSIGFFLQFISVFLFSQTFSKNNPAVIVQEGVVLYTADDFCGEIKVPNNPEVKTNTGKTEIYIAKSANIYGVEHFGNSTFKKEKAIVRRSERKRTAASSKCQKAEPYNPEKKILAISFVKSSESRHTFFAWSEGCLGIAVLNNNPVIQKFQIAYGDLDLYTYSFIKESARIFSTCGFSPVKEEVLAHYSRPPPLIIVLTA